MHGRTMAEGESAEVECRVGEPKIRLHATFFSFDQLQDALEEYSRDRNVQLVKVNSRSVQGINKAIPEGKSRYLDRLKYSYITYGCKHYGTVRTNGTGKRPKQWTYKLECPMKIVVRGNKTKDGLTIVNLIEEHNHDVSSEIYKSYPEQRRVDSASPKRAKSMLDSGTGISPAKIGRLLSYISADDINAGIKTVQTALGQPLRPPPSGSGRTTHSVRQEGVITNLDLFQPFIKARETTSFQIHATQDTGGDVPQAADHGDEGNNSANDLQDSSQTVSAKSKRSNTSKRPGPNTKKPITQKSQKKPIDIPIQEIPEDEEGLIGKLVAAKLRKITNVRIRCEVTCKIHQALLEGELASVEAPVSTVHVPQNSTASCLLQGQNILIQ